MTRPTAAQALTSTLLLATGIALGSVAVDITDAGTGVHTLSDTATTTMTMSFDGNTEASPIYNVSCFDRE